MKLNLKFTTKDIALNGIVAAFYVAITFLCYPLAFGPIQFRLSEMLMLLCFFNPKLTIGLTLGCVLSNLQSTLGPLDAVFGGLATLLACILTCVSPKLIVAMIMPVIANGFIVAAELYYLVNEPFWMSVLTVSLGELAVMVLGYIIMLIVVRHYKKFLEIIGGYRRLDTKF